MTTRLGRRGLAAAAALLPVSALIRSANAQPANETTFDRVRRTKTLRIAALPGELPYFQKDLASGEWSGACIDMAKDIAKVFDAQLAYVESTYGNSVLDLQSNKVDLAFALNPTPQRALSIGFTHPMIVHPFGCVARKGLDPNTWDDLNKPEIKVVYDIGSLHEVAAKRYCPMAQLTGYKSRDECTLALQSAGRARGGAAELSRHPARAGYPLRRRRECVDRLQPRYWPDPRVADRRAREVRRQA
jgi:polar amino acid transport system substrate-binding protein